MTLAEFLPLLLVGIYLGGAAGMARSIYLATDGGRALIGGPAATLGACLMWVVAWPVFVVLLLAVVFAGWVQR